jgi:hypothetical protein
MVGANVPDADVVRHDRDDVGLLDSHNFPFYKVGCDFELVTACLRIREDRPNRLFSSAPRSWIRANCH